MSADAAWEKVCDELPRLVAIARYAAQVRVLQKRYFADRSTTNLIASKDAEKKLDALIADCRIKLDFEPAPSTARSEP